MKLTSYYADNLIGVANARVVAERIIELNPEVVDGNRITVTLEVPILDAHEPLHVKVVLFDYHHSSNESFVAITVPESARGIVETNGIYDDCRIKIKWVNE